VILCGLSLQGTAITIFIGVAGNLHTYCVVDVLS